LSYMPETVAISGSVRLYSPPWISTNKSYLFDFTNEKWTRLSAFLCFSMSLLFEIVPSLFTYFWKVHDANLVHEDGGVLVEARPCRHNFSCFFSYV
jgi:hypothetical protein